MALYRRPRSPFWWMDVSVGEPPKRERLSTKRRHLMDHLPSSVLKPRTKEQREAKAQAQQVEAEHIRRALDRQQLGVKDEITLREACCRLLVQSRHLASYDNLKSRLGKMVGLKFIDGPANGLSWEPNEDPAEFHLDPEMAFHTLTTGDVERFRSARLAEGKKPAAVNTQVSGISNMINKARDIWQVRAPVDVKINRYPTQPKLRYLTTEEERRLLKELDPHSRPTSILQHRKHYQDQYDLTIFLLDTGARYSEVASITWSAIDTNTWKQINIYRSKVGNEGILGMTARLREVLQRRWTARPNNPYVFTNRQGGPRKYTTYGIRQAIERANLNEPHLVDRYGRCTVHSFRDTFATKCLRAGRSLYEVSKLLGHSNMVMTQKYAHLEMADVAIAAAEGLDELNGEAA